MSTRPGDDRPDEAPVIRRGRARPSLDTRRPFPLAMWGILLVTGGVLTWAVIPHRRPPVPDVWRISAVGADAQMTSTIRDPGHGAAPLLRLEWPAHPQAVEYRLRFRALDGTPGPTPLAVPTPVFLYDLHSDVLRLPREFEWEVTAVLPDGSEVVSPWRRHPSR